ncbi:MAG: hypothetical protein KA770_11130, partial [Shewanella sp.]|nr:hypothetical protein [Shewanella sp.]
ILRDTTSQAVIAKQLVWLEFMRQQDLPEKVSDILKHRHSQNKVDAEILHYKIATKVNQSEFQAGYSTIQEQVSFSLVPFARYLERGKAKIYKEVEGKISYESVERRYQVNLILVLRDGREAPQYIRYKITMNRSAIIEITQSQLPDSVNAPESTIDDE